MALRDYFVDKFDEHKNQKLQVLFPTPHLKIPDSPRSIALSIEPDNDDDETYFDAFDSEEWCNMCRLYFLFLY